MKKGETEPDARYQENGQSCLEVLVVDDGSTDHTGKIADQYAKIYPDTVRVIHKENGGHGSGINCGIREGARPVSKGRRCRRLGRAGGIFKFIRCIGTYQR